MWRDALRYAAALGLSPADFWALSWREWCWLTAPRNENSAPPTMPRARLDDLMTTFPDDPR